MPSDDDSRPASNVKRPSVWRAYSYAWITLGFFIISLVGHWVFGWFAPITTSSERLANRPNSAAI
ncbi:hypothetical protein [Mesorhizobium sp.]|uniref:hypothetical protein n=1 Tax=Mesorhizobium sp. TaxID=1871066 RepID=UPI00257DD61B|nr:hypothetical protein [Mesorhizobium sp.]